MAGRSPKKPKDSIISPFSSVTFAPSMKTSLRLLTAAFAAAATLCAQEPAPAPPPQPAPAKPQPAPMPSPSPKPEPPKPADPIAKAPDATNNKDKAKPENGS